MSQKILLKPSRFQVEQKEEAIEQAAAFEASTPLTANKGEHRVNFEELPFTSEEALIKFIKQHFSVDTDEKTLDFF